MNYLKKQILLIILVCFSIGPATIDSHAEILVPDTWDHAKYIISKTGQIFVPEKTIQVIQKFESHLEKVSPKSFNQYLKVKDRFYQFAGYASWKAATDLPFVGIANAFDIPGIISFSLSQIFWQEYMLDKFKLAERIDKVLPQALPTLDIKLQDGNLISLYVKKGKVNVRESIWNKKKGLIQNIRFANNGQQILIQLKNQKNRIKINVSKIQDFRINEEFKSKIQIKGKNVVESFINPNGWPTVISKLNPFTTFVFENGGKGYTTTASYALEKYLKILIGSNLSWPMYEIGRQFWHGGALNLYPYAQHSIGLYSSFVTGGYFGSAIGSRVIDIAALSKFKFENQFPNLCARLPRIKIPFPRPRTNDSCAGLLTKIMGNKNVQRPTELTLDSTREYLQQKYGGIYFTASMTGSIVAGGTMALYLPRFYHNKETEFINWLYRNENQTSDHSGEIKMAPGDGVDYSLAEPEQKMVDQSRPNLLTELYAQNFSSYAVAADKSWQTISHFQTQDDQTNQNTDVYNQYKNNFTNSFRDPTKDMMWINYLLTQPIQSKIKTTIQEIENTTDIISLKEILKQYCKDADILTAYPVIEQSTISNDLDISKDKLQSFIQHSDMIVLEAQMRKWQRELAHEK